MLCEQCKNKHPFTKNSAKTSKSQDHESGVAHAIFRLSLPFLGKGKWFSILYMSGLIEQNIYAARETKAIHAICTLSTYITFDTQQVVPEKNMEKSHQPPILSPTTPSQRRMNKGKKVLNVKRIVPLNRFHEIESKKAPTYSEQPNTPRRCLHQHPIPQCSRHDYGPDFERSDCG